MIFFQGEIDRGLKDVREQREQLYRKLDVLKAQGIELGPNMAVLKSDPLPTKASMTNADVYFYSEVSPNSESPSSANNSNRFDFFHKFLVVFSKFNFFFHLFRIQWESE